MIETENFVQFSRNNLPLATDNQRFFIKSSVYMVKMNA